MIALYYSNGQSTGRNPVHTDSAARIRRGPRGCACWFSPLLVAKGAVCVRPFGPRGFRRNRSKRHANHSFQNRWPNDRFGEKKALVERGRLTEVDGRFLIKWFSMRSMLRENWLVLASLSAFGGDCRDFFRISYSTMSLVVINVLWRRKFWSRLVGMLSLIMFVKGFSRIRDAILFEDYVLLLKARSLVMIDGD